MTTTVNRKDLLQALRLADKVSDRKGFYAAAWCKITVKDGVKGAVLKLKMGLADDPVLITSDSNPGLRYVLMPVRV